jgi:hypothetical protein
VKAEENGWKPQARKRARVAVLYDDGTTVEAEGLWQMLGDMAAWELAEGEPWPRAGAPLSHRKLLWLVYRVLLRSGQSVEPFNAWVERTQDVGYQAIDDEAEADVLDPTGSAPQPTS